MEIGKIIQILNRKYKIEVKKADPFKTLIGVLLSHRTKDVIGWPAGDRLFKRAKNLNQMLKLSEKEIAKIIYPVGFYRQKAKRIKQICKILKEKYKGRVPKTREELMKLPGVGGKSSDIVLLVSYGKNVIPVDTHVALISRRWYLTEHNDPEKIREDLHKMVPEKFRKIFNNLLVEFGKEYCTARFPKCYTCPVEKLCPYESKNLKL